VEGISIVGIGTFTHTHFTRHCPQLYGLVYMLSWRKTQAPEALYMVAKMCIYYYNLDVTVWMQTSTDFI